MTLIEDFRNRINNGDLDLAPLAEGRTRERFQALQRLSCENISLGRLAEAHVDALQILREANRQGIPGASYGVWAAEDPSCELRLVTQDGQSRLVGTKSFCTGAGFIDRALVTVRTPEVLLLDLDIASNRDRFGIDVSGWCSPAFADTATAVVDFAGLEVPSSAVVGGSGWYLDRPGFWNGACGPAACWAGGAQGIVAWAHTKLTAAAKPHPIRDVAIGTLAALADQMDAVVAHAAHDIDADPSDEVKARRRALAVRHNIERGCTSVLDVVGRIVGPRPLISDVQFQTRSLAVQLYIRQCHAEGDLETLGQTVRQLTVEAGARIKSNNCRRRQIW